MGERTFFFPKCPGTQSESPGQLTPMHVAKTFSTERTAFSLSSEDCHGVSDNPTVGKSPGENPFSLQVDAVCPLIQTGPQQTPNAMAALRPKHVCPINLGTARDWYQ